MNRSALIITRFKSINLPRIINSISSNLQVEYIQKYLIIMNSLLIETLKSEIIFKVRKLKLILMIVKIHLWKEKLSLQIKKNFS